MANDFLGLLGSALGTTPPSYMEGLLGQSAVDDLRKRSIGTGIANALLGYLAMPKNQNLGLGRILAGSAQAGIQGAQGVYNQALEDYQTKAKIDEMQRQKALQERELKKQLQVEALTPQLFQTTPAQYRDVEGQPYFIPAPTAEGAVAPNYGLQSVTPEPTRELVSPARTTLNMDVAQKIAALSKDPLAAYKNIAETVPALRKAGMIQAQGTQENPFTIWAQTATSPNVQKLAKQYETSYANFQIDDEKAQQRIADLAKAEESYTGRTDAAAARQAEADRQYELRKMLAQGQIDQREFQQEMARGQLALRQQLADQKNQKVLPPAALKMESENITAAYESAQLANQVDSQLKSLIASGVQFSPAKNAMLATKSAMGSTDPEVLAYNDFQQFKTKLINDTLRLNKGVQTEGDAVRAANELTNARSTQDVVRSLQKIRNINAQAVAMQNQIVTSRRKTGGLTEDKGYSPAEQVPVPTFESVFYSVNDPAFKALPAGTPFIDGNTGKRKIK